VVSIGRAHVEQEPIRAPGELARVVHHCMAKNPSERPSISELRLMVQKIASSFKIPIPDKPSVLSRVDEALYAKAQSFAVLGKPERALEAIHEYTIRYPERACGWTEASRIFLEIGDSKNAVAAALESLKRDGNNAHAWNNLGVAMQRLGEIQQSIEAFRSAVLCDPYNTGALMQLAWQLTELGKIEESADLFVRALALRPKKQSLLFNAGNAAALMIQKGALLPAQKVLETLVKVNSLNSDARFNLALVYDALSLKDSAISTYQEFLTSNPTDTVAHLHLARLLGEAGQFATAIQHCDVCIEADFERARACSYKARSLKSLNRTGEALRVLRLAARMEPDHEPLWFELAEFEARTGDRAEALKAADSMLLEGAAIRDSYFDGLVSPK
jgi:tetratricopeptide (TPR) repeat protein